MEARRWGRWVTVRGHAARSPSLVGRGGLTEHARPPSAHLGIAPCTQRSSFSSVGWGASLQGCRDRAAGHPPIDTHGHPCLAVRRRGVCPLWFGGLHSCQCCTETLWRSPLAGHQRLKSVLPACVHRDPCSRMRPASWFTYAPGSESLWFPQAPASGGIAKASRDCSFWWFSLSGLHPSGGSE